MNKLKIMKLLTLLVIFWQCNQAPKKSSNVPVESSLPETNQLVVVVSPDDSSITGSLYCFEKIAENWKAHESFPITLGRSGLAWGKGLHKTQDAYQKQEGDGKSPAGFFRFGTAFGYAETTDFKLPYVSLTKMTQCIEDVNSKYYNKIVNSETTQKDWDQNDNMRRDDNLYKWGVFVEHNVPAESGSGSCIFLHLWRASNKPTAGCTAMAEENMFNLLKWLDPVKKPLLVQLTATDYTRWKTIYNLPEIKL